MVWRHFDTVKRAFSGISKRERFHQDLEKLAADLDKRWTEGDLEGNYELGKFKCPDLIENRANIHSSYFQCNSYYLLCFLRGQSGADAPENFDFVSGRALDRGTFLAQLKHIESGLVANLKFEERCREVELPSSIYSAGPEEGSKFLWDNHGQKVNLDKRYVTNGDVKIWLDRLGKTNEILVKDYHKPSLGLSKDQRQKYCQSIGGQLMQSRQFDAATFLPAKVENNYIYKFPLPWTKRKDAIQRILRGKGMDCDKLFSRECMEKGFEYHSTYSPSWIGIYHSLGSYPESFDNKFMPNADTKLSSLHLPLESPWHQLGLRAGEARVEDLASYNGEKLELLDNKTRSAFRCVHYR